jgi:hypothetical protein
MADLQTIEGLNAEIERLKLELSEANATIERQGRYIGRLIDGPAEWAETRRKAREREEEEREWIRSLG